MQGDVRLNEKSRSHVDKIHVETSAFQRCTEPSKTHPKLSRSMGHKGSTMKEGATLDTLTTMGKSIDVLHPHLTLMDKSTNPQNINRFVLDAQLGVIVNNSNIPRPPLYRTTSTGMLPFNSFRELKSTDRTSASTEDDLSSSSDRNTCNVTPRRHSHGDFHVCHAPRRFSNQFHRRISNQFQNYFIPSKRRTSNMSIVSDMTLPNQETPTIPKDPYNLSKSKSLYFQDVLCTNNPHQALEFPPLYFVLRHSPKLLDLFRSIYNCRWNMSYILQRRLCCSKMLGKAGVVSTWGELILVLPFFALIVAGTFFSFFDKSVSMSGHMARTPLIFCFVTAMRNSFLTLLFGIPIDRALWYHKLSARLAYVNGILHTYVAFVHPTVVQNTGAFPPSTLKGNDTNFAAFLFSDQVNSGGTMLIVFMTLMMITAMPWIRHRIFELFHFCHVIFALSMIICALFHTGKLVPILAASTWGLDLFIRKVYMPLFRNPRCANIRIISDSVIELCFPKTDGFDYNPGQYIYLAVPELSIFEWHPFSLSSCPGQKIVTLHIRKCGSWTSDLYSLAKEKTQIKVLMEGPYGSVGVDLLSDRYKMVMLFAGGIGVTPMQAICNHLMSEQSIGKRELKKLSFIWVERDPVVMKGVDVVRCTSNVYYSSSRHLNRQNSKQNHKGDAAAEVESDHTIGIASTLLSMVATSNVTDEEFEQQYPSEEFADLDNAFDENDCTSLHNDSNGSFLSQIRAWRRLSTSTSQVSKAVELDSDIEQGIVSENDTNTCAYDVDDEETLVRKAYNMGIIADDHQVDGFQALDLQVYLTGKLDANSMVAQLPFVHLNRPDVKKLFADMRSDAISNGEKHVAVCICAPARLVKICRKACVKYSDRKVQFDFHEEIFG